MKKGDLKKIEIGTKHIIPQLAPPLNIPDFQMEEIKKKKFSSLYSSSGNRSPLSHDSGQSNLKKPFRKWSDDVCYGATNNFSTLPSTPRNLETLRNRFSTEIVKKFEKGKKVKLLMKLNENGISERMLLEEIHELSFEFLTTDEKGSVKDLIDEILNERSEFDYISSKIWAPKIESNTEIWGKGDVNEFKFSHEEDEKKDSFE